MKTIISILLLSICSLAQLPDAPKPQTIPCAKYDPTCQHQFTDWTNTIGILANAGLKSFDIAYTCKRLSTGTFHEDWLPTQKCSGVVGYTLLNTGVTVGGSYLLHRFHRHRLERILLFGSAVGTGSAIVYSLSNR